MECKKSRSWEKGSHVATRRKERDTKENKTEIEDLLWATWEEEEPTANDRDGCWLKCREQHSFIHPVNEIDVVEMSTKRSCHVSLFLLLNKNIFYRRRKIVYTKRHRDSRPRKWLVPPITPPIN